MNNDQDSRLSGATQTDDASAVREIVARASRLQNDVAGLLELHTPDTVIVNIAGRQVLGRAAFAKAMSAALASPLTDVRTSVEVVDLRFPLVDVAIVSCVKNVYDGRTAEDRTDLPGSGVLSYTMIRTPDGWRIAHAQTTPIIG